VAHGTPRKGARHFNNDGEPTGYATGGSGRCSVGSAARFFYCAKANKKDRNEGLDGFEEKRPDERSVTGMGTFEEKGVAKQANHHPTVKPTDLMRYLCRLVTPPNGTVLTRSQVQVPLAKQPYWKDSTSLVSSNQKNI
jgi:DNA modification methylase